MTEKAMIAYHLQTTFLDFMADWIASPASRAAYNQAMKPSHSTARLLWWLIIAFVAAVFLALPAAMIGYGVGGAVIGGVAVLGTLILIQLPIMLFALRGTSFTFGKPPDDGA